MWVHQVSQDRRSNSNPCDVSTKQCESAMSVHELKAVGTCERRPKGQWEDGGDGRDRGQFGRPISIRAAGGVAIRGALFPWGAVCLAAWR
jgi:hypothetical protein